MSRLSERLARVRKSSGSIGFGFEAARADARRMLVLPVIDDVPSGDTAEGIRDRADGIVFQHNPGEGEKSFHAIEKEFPNVPVGLRLAGPDFDERALVDGSDFVLCTFDAPLSILSLSSTGVLVEQDAGTEASRLRALSDLGMEGVVVTSESLALRSLSAAVECRRVRAMTGCPVLVKVLEPLSPAAVTGLWKAGVDGLITDAGGGIDLLVSVRDSVDQAKLDTQTTQTGFAVSIGNQLGRASEATEDETGEDDDCDDE